MSGTELLDFAPIWKTVKMQTGQKKLSFKSDLEYNLVLKLVEQHRNWASNNPELSVGFIQAFKNPETIEDKPPKK